jgi:RNA polymerase sigma factor (sigma-70 family)
MAGGPLGNVIRFLRRAVGPEAGTLSDRQLLARFAHRRDEVAFGSLVERHGPMVWAACRRVLGAGPDAEDAFQAAFLVLAQKAGAAGWQESVSSWLYQVAYRVAIRARRDIARRRRREEEAAKMLQGTPRAAAEGGELRAVLDEELSRLPERFRAPVVLCYLQGKTNDEAAQALGWPRGTVASRLSRARNVLRSRLTRRGLTLPATALAASLHEAVASAALPPALVQSTIKAAALLPAANALAAGAISGPVASLTQGVLRTMFFAKLKLAAPIVVVLAIFGTGSGVVAYHMLTASPLDVPATPLGERPPEGPEKPRVSTPVVKDGLSVTIQPTKAVFGKDEEPAVEFIFTNVSKNPFKLGAMNYFPEGQAEKADLQDVRTGQSWRGTYFGAKRAASPAPFAADLAPEQSFKCASGLYNAPWGTWEWQPKDNGPVMRTLPPGKYRVTYQLAFRAGFQGKKEDYWTGDLVTNPTEFKIDDKPAGSPVVKDGLSVTVVTHKDYYTRGERPAVSIDFKNTTNKPITFHNPAHAVRIWTFAFTDLKRTVKWEAHYPAGINTLPPQKIAAGESAALYVDFYQVDYQAVDADRARTVKELPPGRYRLTITVKLDDLPAAQFANAWSGEIRTNSVEFEIAAK